MIMQIIYITISAVSFFLAILILIQYLVYGKTISGPQVDSIINRNRHRMSRISENIISISGGGFILTVPIGIICKYYIQDAGQIPRWSKAHRIIEDLYKELHWKKVSKLHRAFGETQDYSIE